MAQESYPFEDTVVSESQYTRLFREFQVSGVMASVDATSDALIVSANSSGMTVTVGSGSAVVRGHGYRNTSALELPITAGPTSSHHLVVLELSPTTNTIEAKVIPDTTVPTQTDTAIYQLPLADVFVRGGAVTIGAADVSDRRWFVGGPVAVWSSVATRNLREPRRVGDFGYNVSAGEYQYWDGDDWKSVGGDWSDITGKPSVFPPSFHNHSWDSITGKPLTYPASPHNHTWSQVTGKPSTFQPSAHDHNWSDITGKPSSFPPDSHSHSWGSISGKPSSFPPESHTHGGGAITSAVESAITANGSLRPHQREVSGPGPWYSVWVRGDGGFCRNTSSRKYKENIRPYALDGAGVHDLEVRLFDRRETVDDDGTVQAGTQNEVGLIAEEVAEIYPEFIVYDEAGEVDGIRFDLLTLPLIQEVKSQKARIEALEARLTALEGRCGGCTC